MATRSSRHSSRSSRLRHARRVEAHAVTHIDYSYGNEKTEGTADQDRKRGLFLPGSVYTAPGWFVERGTYLALVRRVWAALSKSSCHPMRLVRRPLSHATLKAKQRVDHAIDRRLRWAKSCMSGT